MTHIIRSKDHVHQTEDGQKDRGKVERDQKGKGRGKKVYSDGKGNAPLRSSTRYEDTLLVAAAAAALESLSSTRSLCCRFLKWTSKLSTVMPGPGVYSLPGQS